MMDKDISPKYTYFFLFRAMLEANLSSALIFSAPLSIPLMIFAWPAAILLLLLQCLLTLILLPVHIFLIPFSRILSDKKAGPYSWMFCYGFFSALYVLLLGTMASNPEIRNTLFFPVFHSVLVGFFTWMQVDKKRYEIWP